MRSHLIAMVSSIQVGECVLLTHASINNIHIEGYRKLESFSRGLRAYFLKLLRKFSLLWSMILMIQAGHKLAHITTAQLSWHVQNCDQIRSLLSKKIKFLQDKDYKLIEPAWNGSLNDLVQKWIYAYALQLYPFCTKPSLWARWTPHIEVLIDECC